MTAIVLAVSLLGILDGSIKSGKQTVEAMSSLTAHETIERYAGGQLIDSVELDTELHRNAARYSSIGVKGRPNVASLERLTAPWSTGEYAQLLQEAITRMESRSGHLASRLSGDGRLLIVEIEVRHPNGFSLTCAGKTYKLPYLLTIYIDTLTAQISRIVQTRKGVAADGVPATEQYVDFNHVLVSEKQYWLPSSGRFRSLEKGSDWCNRITFENYREFTVASQLTFPIERGK